MSDDDDAYYAESASISSNDSAFAATDDGGSVTFPVEGGTVVINVDCGTDWIAENHATDLFEATANAGSGTLTVTAGQNTVEDEVTGTISLMTASKHIEFATVVVCQDAYGAPHISVETEQWTAPARGALSTQIAVESSEEWGIAETEPWLIAERSGDELYLTASSNEDTANRSAKVVLSCTDGIRTASATVTVVQDGAAYITPSLESVSFDYIPGTVSVTVKSNYDWEYSADGDWFTVERNGSAITVTATMNESEESREGTLTLTAGDGAENVAEVQLAVIQSGAHALPLVLTYKTTSANSQIKLPLYGEVSCSVDWGDGNVEEVTEMHPSHTYSSAGEYDVSVSGTVTALNAQSFSSTTNAPLIAVKQWGNTGLTSMEYAFNECQALSSIPDDDAYSFMDVTSFAYAFNECSALQSIPSGLFAHCQNVTSFEGTFKGCEYWGLTTLPAGLFANCTKATTFDNAFYNCKYLRTLPDGLFSGCTATTSFNYTFAYCWGLTSMPERTFENCSNVQSFKYTFTNCVGLSSVPEGLFADCTKVTSFLGLFWYCSNLATVPEGLFASCREVTSFEATFWSSGITTLPEGIFANNPNVVLFDMTFDACTSLASVPAGLFANNLKATNFEWTFYNCSALFGESPYNLVNGVKVHLYERSSYTTELNCTAPSSYSRCFYNCLGLDDYYSMSKDWR